MCFVCDYFLMRGFDFWEKLFVLMVSAWKMWEYLFWLAFRLAAWLVIFLEHFSSDLLLILYFLSFAVTCLLVYFIFYLFYAQALTRCDWTYCHYLLNCCFYWLGLFIYKVTYLWLILIILVNMFAESLVCNHAIKKFPFITIHHHYICNIMIYLSSARYFTFNNCSHLLDYCMKLDMS